MELFDQVRAAPPPDRIRDTKPVVQTENGSADGIAEDDADNSKDILMPSPVAATPSPDFTLHNKKANAETNDEVKLSGSAKRKFSNDDSHEKGESGVKPTTEMSSKVVIDEPEAQTDIERDSDEQPQEQQQQQLLSPPKTKAEQKMFIDHHHHHQQPESTVAIPTTSVFTIKACHVRIKKLTQKEITLHTAKRRPGSQRKRTRKSNQPAAATDPDPDLPSPSKKAKLSNKIHIKVPLLQNGAKQRNAQKLAREHTPPPSKMNRKAKGKYSPSSGGGVSTNRPIASAELIKRYGAKYFGCVVKLKRIPMPPWPVHDTSFSLNNSNASSKRRSKKQNLSVSFSEAVEIFGSSETGTRRSTLGSARPPRKGCETVPTRLQRVDATGNILEDIALTSNAMLYGPRSAKRARRSGGAIEESVKATCNGDGSLSRKLKRSLQRVPVAGLASLRLEDKSKAADEDDDGADDDEYIVPNELPGIHRAGTPIATPIKKKITVTTTTISDDDDEEQEEVKKVSGDSLDTKESKRKDDDKEQEKEQESPEQGKFEKELIKEVNKSDKLKDDEKKKEQEELIKEQEEKKNKEDDEVEQSEETKEKGISSSEKAETTNIITETENIIEKEIETLKVTSDIKESSPIKLRVEDEETSPDEGENNMEPLLVSQTDISSSKEMDCNDKQDEPEDPKPQADEDDDEKKTNNDKKSNSSPLLGNTTSTISVSKAEDPDDILEIATSLDDVRDLHTPLSPNSRCSTPQGVKVGEHIKKIVEQLPPRSRLESGDSESSFKSATELDTATEATNVDNAATNNETTTITITTEAAEAAKSPATTTTTISTLTTTRGESPSDDTTPFPSLNDEVLEELAEPDFQLNNSRHTISTGTLDDIMTALES